LNKLLLILLFSAPVVFCSAQNYKTVYAGNNSHFSYTDVNQPGKTFYNTISIDSVSVLFNGEDLFNFESFGDTAGGCLHANRHTWIASKIYHDAGGDEYYLNRYGDTIYFKPAAALNDTWHFYNYANGNYIEAKVTGIAQQTFIGITDSVKTITLNAKNSSGNPISNLLNGKQVKISENHGFVQTFGYRYFPADTATYPLVGLGNEQAGVTNLTARDIYNFDVGDEFHYDVMFWYSASSHDHNRFIYVVLSKSFSSDSDSVTYRMTRCGQFDHFDWPTHTITPVNDTSTQIYDFSQDGNYITVSLNQFSWQKRNANPPEAGYLSFYRDTTYLNRIKKQTHYLFSPGASDTCYETSVAYCLPSDVTYARGLGWIYTTDNWCVDYSLVYYKKGAEEWGTPLSCSVLLSTEDISTLTGITIYPNPFTNELRVSGADAAITLYDYTGKIIISQKTTTAETTINTTGMAAGMYFLRVESGGGVKNFRVIKQ
jgi:hypothetical protein